ncbi:CDK5 regulatory subunit-associated protein 3 isoform X2 [Ambystoma mexicanum]|uniref:CDK5 regulatory subunit-associated protein 3 isoform X2 n=1 Tax=Ambystoma mexicanum TaxID=8296 RepID=UPI0037E7B1CB
MPPYKICQRMKRLSSFWPGPVSAAEIAGADVHYFHCLRIVEILKGTEASSKNMFGRYSSQRMKDWQEIVSLYERDNTYLAELASLLFRNVSYEIPSLKKQIGKCQQLQQEYSRREEENQLGAADMKDRFYASCKQYGITGEDMRRELQALVSDLPSLLREIGAATSVLSGPINLYQAFVQFICDSPSEEVVPMLRHVQEHGDTTVYEWRTGMPPIAIQHSNEAVVPEQAGEEAIDWGDFGTEPVSPPKGIDYGITINDEGENSGVDWGICLEPDPAAAGGDDIDWNITEVSAEELMTVLESETPASDGVARGPDALTILQNPETRSQFVDELLELEIFLMQRIMEMKEEADVVSVSQFQLAPSILQGQTSESVTAMASSVKDLIGRLTGLRMQHLFMILASPRYVDRVCERLRQWLKQAELLEAKKELMVRRRQEALEEQRALEPRLDLLLQRTKELQKLIETDISKRYNNRPVNLMGTAL